MYHSRLVGVLTLLITTESATGQTDQQIAAQTRALEVILNAADRICERPPLEQHSDTVELNGEAKETLSGVLSRITDLGINGAAKYTRGESKGVLQEQLAGAIKAGNDCRKDVLATLRSMIPGLAAASSRIGSHVGGRVRQGDVHTGIDTAVGTNNGVISVGKPKQE